MLRPKCRTYFFARKGSLSLFFVIFSIRNQPNRDHQRQVPFSRRLFWFLALMKGGSIMANFEKLSPVEQAILTWIVEECINQGKVTRANKEIAAALAIPLSTLEKKLKILEDGKFITRLSDRAMNPLTQQWETISRTILINPHYIQPSALALLKANRLEEVVNAIRTPEGMMAGIQSLLEKRGKDRVTTTST